MSSSNLFLEKNMGEVIRDENYSKYSITFWDKDMPFLKDHVFQEKYLLPGAVSLDLMMEACLLHLNKGIETSMYTEAFSIKRPLFISVNEAVAVNITVKGDFDNTCRVEIRGDRRISESTLRKNMLFSTAVIKIGTEESKPSIYRKDLAAVTLEMDSKDYYINFSSTHGPFFQILSGKFLVSSDTTELISEFTIPETEKFYCSPLGMDGILQLGVFLAFLNNEKNINYTKIPVAIKGLYIKKAFQIGAAYSIHAKKIKCRRQDEFHLEVAVVTRNGEEVIHISELILKEAPYVALNRENLTEKLRSNSSVAIEHLPVFMKQYPHLAHQTEAVHTKQVFELQTVVDLNVHQYLKDHVFIDQSYVPGTMIMELFAESASLYMDLQYKLRRKDYEFSGIDDLDIKRAIKLDSKNNRKKINLTVLMTEQDLDGSVKVKMLIGSKRLNQNGEEIGNQINASATVIFSDHTVEKKTENCEIPFECLENIEHYHIPKNIYYGNFFQNLGYLFHACTGNFAVSGKKDFLIGFYSCENKEAEFIKNNEDRQFIISPLGYDSTVQYAVFLSRIEDFKGRLPVACKRVRKFKEHEKDGRMTVLIKKNYSDESRAEFDLVSCNDKKEPVFALEKLVVKNAPIHKNESRERFFAIWDRYKQDERRENEKDNPAYICRSF